MGLTKDRNIFLLITGGRLVLFLLILGVALFAPEAFPSSKSALYFSIILGSAFFFTAVYIDCFKRWGLTVWLKIMQTVVDVILVSITVYLTGGIDSPFTFLYAIAIITACLLSPDRTGSLSALLSTAFYALIAVGTWQHVGSNAQAGLTFFLNAAAFNIVALLSINLTKRLKRLETRLSTTKRNLRIMEEIQRHLAESLKSGLITTNRSGEIVYYNSAALGILGDELSQAYQKPLKTILPINDKIFEDCQTTSSSESRHELCIETDKGGKILGISCFSITDDQGEGLGSGFLFKDITEIKARQKRLQLVDRLAALGEMAAGLAHEIRNPLASISGAAEFLEQGGFILPEGTRLMEIIRKETERLNKLTTTFLLYGRPEKKNLKEINVKEAVSSVLDLTRQRKKLVQADIELQIPDDLFITADSHMFTQVLLNLMLNAFQALPDKDGKIRISGMSSDSEIYIEIEDNGVGIDKEHAAKIFHPFFTTRAEGTGLGLAVVHRIITELGGNIDMDSTPGEGTIFKLTFPKFSSGPDTREQDTKQ